MKTFLPHLFLALKRRKERGGKGRACKRAGFFPPAGLVDLVLRKTCLRPERKV